MVHVALVTTTRGSSEFRPDGEAEARSRFVALCGAKQEPQGFVAEPKNQYRFRSNISDSTSTKICPAADLSRVSTENNVRGAVPVLTYLAMGRLRDLRDSTKRSHLRSARAA